MNKELPSIFVNKINKEIKNDQEIFTNINRSYKKNINVNKKINEIFKSTDFVYKKDVKIIIKNKIYDKTIVGINNNYLLTIDNEIINISDIEDINIKD